MTFNPLPLLTLVVFSLTGPLGAQDIKPETTGAYMGQSKPGKIPRLFAPNLISVEGRYEFGITFSKDLKEIYFSGNKEGELSTIFYTKQVNGVWTPVKKANFTKDKVAGELHPFISHDGKRIYFTGHDAEYGNNDIWYVERHQKSWGEAKKLVSPINEAEVFDSNEAQNGDLFYTDIYKAKIYHAPKIDGKFPKKIELPIEAGFHGFASLDQDFIIADDRHKENASRKDRDLYVYFKTKDGSWSQPINMGQEVNSSFNETVPSLSPDGKYLFFSRYNEKNGLSNLYWVNASVIEDLRPRQ
ncbi:hypothetical protein QGN29_09530 [Temperatibacter marinus]|uniref:WD40-like Beta Propeller Repeat n=1 Tax=Temperatibacter marinus TaxID=1456591 RepID=A0AA52H8T3_9PROT|nr:hypothetical protein [Temperatibacter marinus]WND01792.1 hypothetical protein QGN29_09530 [Temperatibacter marinus]